MRTGKERLSTAFFLDADFDCVVDPADIPATCAVPAAGTQAFRDRCSAAACALLSVSMDRQSPVLTACAQSGCGRCSCACGQLIYNYMVCRDREGVAKQPAQPPITQGAYLMQRFRETMPKSTTAEQ